MSSPVWCPRRRKSRPPRFRVGLWHTLQQTGLANWFFRERDYSTYPQLVEALAEKGIVATPDQCRMTRNRHWMEHEDNEMMRRVVSRRFGVSGHALDVHTQAIRASESGTFRDVMDALKALKQLRGEGPRRPRF